ncbi:MAG: DCC1-like thiol-disulfide oxidoreductase family protein [Phycisphaera sp.]|nr:MAG: DCC1-like thiol-disulfide oxidoreductase family protein [Phycisphaera sp.]
MPETHPIILFDGTCGLCDRTVRLVSRLDRKGRFRFAPLQSEAAAFLFQRHHVPESIDSIVLVHQGSDGGRARVQSDAAIGVARLLGFPWSLAVVFLAIPRPIRDAAYRFIARHRYRVFGRVDACGLPTEAQRALVIETREEAERISGKPGEKDGDGR